MAAYVGAHLNIVLGLLALFAWIAVIAWYLKISGIFAGWLDRRRNPPPAPPPW